MLRPFHRARYVLSTFVVLILCLQLNSCAVTKNSVVDKSAAQRSNILLVVADDLGMLDIGAFGSEIRTPSIDQLAQRGVKLTNFYTSATCSPTRSMLFSGTDSHTAGIGNMIEHVAPNQRDKQGYEGHLSHRVVSVAKLLQDAGYQTFMAGKWHLGMTDELLPYRRGFDESFILGQGGASYFNDMMGLNAVVPDAHYRRNGETITELPDDFYASEYYADFIIEQIDNSPKDKPFFAYLSFTAPHWPLQVRDEHVDLYKGRYDAGYEVLQAERVAKAKDVGIIPMDAALAEPPAHVAAWSELSDQEKKVEARTMEVYSATVERMDHHLGRVLGYLEQNDELDNTLIVFMSDNGADGSDRSKLPGNDKWLPEAWDLSYENMGKKGSYVYPGPAWAWASGGNHRMYKEFLSEGGIHTPAIISYPTVSNQGGAVDDLISVQDIAPTMLEYAGVTHPGDSYEGREIASMTGLSLMPIVKGANSINADERVLGWELFGQRVVRKGDWKLLWLSSKPRWLVQPSGADEWGLYNLAQDPAEANNLVEQEPEKFAELLSLWEQYSEEQNVILPEW
ncbi:MAG: arylsulfatase [Acidiferrobacterales bacterium]|nr:arylsulfatase [Acidiferrobacterales bacterium]